MDLSREEKVAIALEILNDRVTDIEYSDVYDHQELIAQGKAVHAEIYEMITSAKKIFVIGDEAEINKN